MKTIYNFMRIALILLVIALGTATAYAQDSEVVKPTKPQKNTATTTTNTTTTQQKPRTNTSASTNNSTQYSSSTATKPTTGTINGHEWVDLGLSVKWATCNVGASSPSDYGNYYAWGETSTKSEYTKENSKTYNKSMGSIAGNPQYDVARANWGGSWRLPTWDEIGELLDRCTWTWTSQGGHKGYKVEGSNGNSIFLPAAGCRHGTSLVDTGQYGEIGEYWSATPYKFNASHAHVLNFCGVVERRRDWNSRLLGQSVRPVSE